MGRDVQTSRGSSATTHSGLLTSAFVWPHLPCGALGVSSKSGTSYAGVASDPGRWEGYTHRLAQVAFGIQTRDPSPTRGAPLLYIIWKFCPSRIWRASTPKRTEALRHFGWLFRNVLEDKRDIVAPLDCLPAHGRRSQYGGDIPGVKQPQPRDYALAYLPIPSRENCTAAFLICASMTELEAIATSSPEQAWRKPPPASSLRTRKLNSPTPEQGKATPDARE